MDNNNVKFQLNSKVGSITFATFMAGYLVVALLGQLILAAIFGEQSTVYRVIGSSLSSLSILGVVLFYIFYGKHSFKKISSLERSGGVYILVAVLLSAGMFLGLGFVNESIAKVFSVWGLNASGISVEMPTVWHLLCYVVTFAILPAIFEEVLFRGILLNCFIGMKRIFAVLICSLIFAVYHQSFLQLLYQFIFGVALSYLALLAKSIVPCIISHFLNNFTVLLLTYLKVGVDLYNPIILVIGANALAFFGTIIFFAQRKAKNTQQVIKGEVKTFFLPYGIFAVVACLAMAVGNLVA